MKIISIQRRDRLAVAFGVLAVAAISLGIALGYLAPPRFAWIFPTGGFVGYVWSSTKAMRLWSGFRGAPTVDRFLPQHGRRIARLDDWRNVARSASPGRALTGH